MIDGLVDTDLRHTPDVPQIALFIGDKVVRHPEDGSDVAWKVTDRTRDEDGRLVVTFTTPDGERDFFVFTDPYQNPAADVGPVIV